MEARAENSRLDFETLFSGFRELLNGSGLTGAPATKFALKRVKTRYLTLFRATKNCVVICIASLLYEMGYPFRSAFFVPMEFFQIERMRFRHVWSMMTKSIHANALHRIYSKIDKRSRNSHGNAASDAGGAAFGAVCYRIC